MKLVETEVKEKQNDSNEGHSFTLLIRIGN